MIFYTLEQMSWKMRVEAFIFTIALVCTFAVIENYSELLNKHFPRDFLTFYKQIRSHATYINPCHATDLFL